MKKVLIILCLICLPVMADAGAIIVKGPVISSAPDTCSACPSDADGGDTVCEDFEVATTGYLGAWSESDGGADCTINPANTHSAGFTCANKGTQDISFTHSGSGATNCYTEYTFAASKGTLYASFYLDVTESAFSGAANRMIGILKNGTTSQIFWRIVYVDANTVTLELRYLDTSASYQSLSYGNIDEDTVHYIGLKYVGASNSIDVYLDDAVTPVASAADAQNVTLESMVLGVTSTQQTLSGQTYEFDNVRVDDDTLPGECP